MFVYKAKILSNTPGPDFTAPVFTKIAEASFLKLIYTPDDFSEAEISHVLNARNLENKWEKCFELALKKVLN